MSDGHGGSIVTLADGSSIDLEGIAQVFDLSQTDPTATPVLVTTVPETAMLHRPPQ